MCQCRALCDEMATFLEGWQYLDQQVQHEQRSESKKEHCRCERRLRHLVRLDQQLLSHQVRHQLDRERDDQ